MPYSNDDIEIRKQEKETQAFKVFTRVAKKIKHLEYGKWVLTPDPLDPIRKVILSKDIGLATVSLTLYMRDFYHRYNYEGGRYDWKPSIAISGLQQKTKYDDGYIRTGIKVGPRAAKKLIEYVNTKVVPMFYREIEMETERNELQRAKDKLWRENVAKVIGMSVAPEQNSYDRTPIGVLKGCPMTMKLHHDGVVVSGTLTYSQVQDIAEKCGWGK